MNTAKADLRHQLIAARKNVTRKVRNAEAAALISRLRDLAWELPVGTVCAYVPVGSEPGSVEMLDSLDRIASRVLLPVATSAADGTPLPLLWGRYRRGELVRARYGLVEPGGTRLPAAVLQEAQVIIVPALAVDRSGVRLGRGAGFYDRSLPLRNPLARLVAVVRDAELVDKLPGEPHDVRMTGALTPGQGLVTL